MVTNSISRREFLQTTAAAGAGLMLAGSLKSRAAASANGKINVALIGFGAEGRVLLESLLIIEGIQLVAIVEIWDYARKYAQRYLKANGVEVRVYENYEDLLGGEKDLQAVIVATPDFWHAPITNACLKAGLHVYCEKMMSNTIEGARSMVETMRSTGKLLQIGHQRRSNPRYLFALHRLLGEAQLCGRITAAQAQWNRAVSPDLLWPKHSDMSPEKLAQYGFTDMRQFRNWRWFKGLGGGPLSDLGAHQIDIFNWWLGRTAVSVMASGGVDYYKAPKYLPREWYDNALVIYEFAFPEGVTRAMYQVQTTTSAGGGYWEMFMGDEGAIKMSEDPKLCAVFREEKAPSWDGLISKGFLRAQPAPTYESPADATKVDVRETALLAAYDIPVTFNKKPHQPHLENFFNAIRGTASLHCPGDEAFASEYIIHKANEAIPLARKIDITADETKA